MPGYYVDNAYNRRLGRVGMPRGSMPVSRDGSLSFRTYVDNSYNRALGRVGLPHGAMVVHSDGSLSSWGEKIHVESSYRPSKNEYDCHVKTYVDNAYNRSLGRVGMPLGSMVVSKYDTPSIRTYTNDAISTKDGSSGGKHDVCVTPKRKEEPKVIQNKPNEKGKTHIKYEKESNPHQASTNQLRKQMTFESQKTARKSQSFQSQTSDTKNKSKKDSAVFRRLCRVKKAVGTCTAGSHSGTHQTNSDNALTKLQGRAGKQVHSVAVVSESLETALIRRVYRYLCSSENDDCTELEDVMAEIDDNIIEKAIDILNKLKLERQLKIKLTTTSKVQSDSFTGPVIKFEDLQLRTAVGRSRFGVVYYATLNDNIVGVKRIRLKNDSRRLLREFNDEVADLSRLRHPYIVRYFGASTNTPQICVVLEYMQTSLYEVLHIKTLSVNDLEEDDRLLIINQSLCGLEFLHRKDLPHCALKSRNILLNHDGGKITDAKISDYGLSMIKREMETSVSSSQRVSPIEDMRYSAPEVLRGDILNKEQMKMCDMYSYGLLIFEIIFEEEPFSTLSEHQMRKHVGERGKVPNLPAGIRIKDALLRSLQACWDSPTVRPTATELLFATERLHNIYCN